VELHHLTEYLSSKLLVYFLTSPKTIIEEARVKAAEGDLDEIQSKSTLGWLISTAKVISEKPREPAETFPVSDLGYLANLLGVTPLKLFGSLEGDPIADEAFQELLEVSAGALLAHPETRTLTALPAPAHQHLRLPLEVSELGINAEKFLQTVGSHGTDLMTSDDTKAGFEDLFYTPNIVTEQSPPQLTDLVSLMKSGSGAVIGAFTGYTAADHFSSAPLILLLTVPTGILICASAMGLASGIEQGLKQKIYEWITYGTSEQVKVRRARRRSAPRKDA
jgi:hypothetical protein